MNSPPRWRWVVKEGKKEGAPGVWGGDREDRAFGADELMG